MALPATLGNAAVATAQRHRGSLGSPSSSPSSPGLVPSGTLVRQGIDKRKRKTKMCQHWLSQGHCGWGEECAFAHGQEELNVSSDSFVPMTTNNSCVTSNPQYLLHSAFSHSQPLGPKASSTTNSNCSSSPHMALNSTAGTTTGSTASFSGIQAFPHAPNPSPVTTNANSSSSSVELYGVLPDRQGIPTTITPVDNIPLSSETTLTAVSTTQPMSAGSFPWEVSSCNQLSTGETVADDAPRSCDTSCTRPPPSPKIAAPVPPTE